jgi:hypothetical protein
MINIRYHVFSLIAVLLALAIGLAAGSTVVKESIVDNLRDNQDRLESELDDLLAANEQLDLRVGRLEEADRRLRAEGPLALLDARLLGMTVVVVNGEGLDGAVHDAVVDTLGDAGAELAGEIEVRREIVREERQPELAEIVGASQDDDAVAMAAQQLATALVAIDAPPTALTEDGLPEDGLPEDELAGDELAGEGAPAGGTPSTAAPEEAPSTAAPDDAPPDDAPPAPERVALDELLDSLEDAGFVAAGGAVTDADEVIARAPMFVVVGGRPDGDDDDGSEGSDVTPFLTELVSDVVIADDGRTRVAIGDAALADPSTPRSPFVDACRDMGDVWDGVTSVDNLEMFAGLAALALGMEDLRVGRTGHYGVGDNADSLLPVDP